MSIRSLLSCLILWPSLMVAQTTVRTVFKEMPDSLVPYLSMNNRLDMLDFIDSNMKAEVRNQLDGRSQLTFLDDSRLQLRLNDVSQMEMFLLDVDEPVDSASQIVCLIQTLGDNIKESTVRFYSVKWNPLPAERYVRLPRDMFVADWQQGHATLCLTVKDLKDIPANEGQEILPEVQINFKWNGKTFN